MLLECYDESRQPDQLDSLIFQVNKLHRMLLPLEVCDCEVLEALGLSLSLLEELDAPVHMHFVAETISGSRGRPRIKNN